MNKKIPKARGYASLLHSSACIISFMDRVIFFAMPAVDPIRHYRLDGRRLRVFSLSLFIPAFPAAASPFT